jgi:hypothetical protein
LPVRRSLPQDITITATIITITPETWPGLACVSSPLGPVAQQAAT